MERRSRLSISQPGDLPVTDEVRTRSAFVRLAELGDLEIENAHAITRFSLVSPAIARAHHDALIRPLLAAEINHGVSDWRIALDTVSARPKEKITRGKFIQFEGVLLPAVDRLEIPSLADPDILLAGIARDIPNPVLRQHVKNESGAIQPPGRGIG